jgi:hypothetical protein
MDSLDRRHLSLVIGSALCRVRRLAHDANRHICIFAARDRNAR